MKTHCVALNPSELQPLLLQSGNGKLPRRAVVVTRKIANAVLGMVPGTLQVLDTGALQVQSQSVRVRLGATTNCVTWAGVTADCVT